MNHRVYIIFGLIALVILLASGCGRGSREGNVLPQLSAGAGAEALDSAAIDAELAALKTPEGVDPALFSHLKKALASALASVGKTASIPPTGEDNVPANLTFTEGTEGEWTLSWEYRNIGDYDQNGTVGISDITPLAIHYGASIGGDDPLAVVADGDKSGVVGIGDITPIAMNYGVNCTGYEVQFWAPGEDDFAQLDTIPLEDGTGKDEGWRVFAYTFEPVGANWYRVAPYDSEGALGEVSAELEFEATIAPEIIGVVPTSGATGATDVMFSATVTGTAPFTYAWDFGGGATPNTSTEKNPAVTLGATGVYDTCSVTVANEAGEDFFTFALTIGNPPDITEVSPLSGETGTSVTFSAIVTGDEPLNYSWDFGGGADPDTSTDPEPEVTLGAEGSYEASLAVSNDFGEDFFEFALEVTPYSGTPPEILSVEPTMGYAGDEVTFIALVTGTPPIEFDWDFGGGAEPNISTLPMPTVTLSSTAGTYNASLTVTNVVDADTFPFELYVMAVGEYDEVEPNNTRGEANALPAPPVSGWYCCLTEILDEQDFFSFDAATGDIVHIIMRLDEPAFNCDIELQDATGAVLAFSDGAGGIEQIDHLFDADGTYYIRCYAGGGDPGESDYWLDVDLEPYEPWTSVQAGDTGSGDFGEYCNLLVGSPPGIAFYDGESKEPYYASCDTEDGLGEWTTYQIIANPSPESLDIGPHLSAAIVVNFPVVACPRINLVTAQEIPMQIAVCDLPNGSGSWTVLETFDYNCTGSPSVRAVQNKLALAYEAYDNLAETHGAWYAINFMPDGSGFWETVQVDPDNLGARYNSMTIVGSNPAIAYYAWKADPGELRFVRASTTDGKGEPWNAPVTVDSGAGGVGDYCSMSVVTDRPAISYFDTGASKLKYAINDHPHGTAEWHIVTVGINEPGATTLRVIDGYPTIAVSSAGAVRLWQADTANGLGGTWSFITVVTPGALAANKCLNVCDGQPSISYYDPDASVLRFARRPD